MITENETAIGCYLSLIEYFKDADVAEAEHINAMGLGYTARQLAEAGWLRWVPGLGRWDSARVIPAGDVLEAIARSGQAERARRWRTWPCAAGRAA